MWSGARVPRVAVGGGSVALADGRAVWAARRGALSLRDHTARRPVDAVAVDGRRLAWAERGLRRGTRVAVLRLAGDPVRRLALLAALVAALLAAGPAVAAPIAAVQDDALVNVRGAALAARLDALAATGVKVTRVDVLWDQVAPRRPSDARNPADPAYDWSRYDEIARGLRARGITAVLDFYRTPAWASRSGTPDRRRAPPTAPASPGRSRAATRARSPTPSAGCCPG